MSELEIVEKQNEIIRQQANIIDEIFLLLAQHISASEIKELSIIAEISEIAKGQRKLQSFM